MTPNTAPPNASDDAFASDLLRAASAGLDSRDAGLASEIVFGALRFQKQLDFLITHFSGRTAKLDPEVRIALRMGIFQIRYLLLVSRGRKNLAHVITARSASTRRTPRRARERPAVTSISSAPPSA